MISCLLTHISRTPQGLPVSHELRISGESIVVGRGSGCQIHLPDHRVGLCHATVSRTAEGGLQITAEEGELVSIDGFVEHAATLAPGMRVGIGPYLLTVNTAHADADIAVAVEMTESPMGNPELPRTALTGLGISKRRLGFGLAAFILLGLLALPMMARVSPAFENWQAGLPFALTEVLNPGTLSTGHGTFGNKCSTCHERAFHAVDDSACTRCHKQTKLHLAADAEHAQALGSVGCIDCHPVHAGRADAIRKGIPACTACHRNVGTPVADARDFGSRHPDFRLTLPVGKDRVRLRQDDVNMPPEQSGLKFSHVVHLDKKGISTPLGDTVMTCSDCHKLDESGSHFAPMEMEMTCQQSRCHKIRYAEPAVGVVPHGSERVVMDRLRAFYADWLAEDPAALARECGMKVKPGTIIRQTLDCADTLARRQAGATLFKSSGEALECVLCHEVTETDKRDAPWKVAPVRINRDWHPAATFPHARHTVVECADCHDKASSKSSEDIALPPIAKCRECHAGATADAGRVSSNCESCHRFHRVARTPTSP